MGPFGLPWPTFGAILVIVASVIISIVWAMFRSESDGGPHE
jgi:hypothetical protein